MRRLVLKLLPALILAAPPAITSAAVGPNELEPMSCTEINSTTLLAHEVYFTLSSAGDGDVLRLSVGEPSVGSPTSFSFEKKVFGVWVQIPLVPGFPGEAEITADPGDYYVGIDEEGAEATITIRCGLNDTDGDGVDDADDLCADTVLPDVFAKLQANRYSADATGVLSSAKSSTTYTLEQTGGCSATQIIGEMGFGGGHVRFGLSGSALQTWVASVSAG